MQRVIGGSWQLNDTGSADAQVDVVFELGDGTRIAMEQTSEGGAAWLETREAIATTAERRHGSTLVWQWLVVGPSGGGNKPPPPELGRGGRGTGKARGSKPGT